LIDHKAAFEPACGDGVEVIFSRPFFIPQSFMNSLSFLRNLYFKAHNIRITATPSFILISVRWNIDV